MVAYINQQVGLRSRSLYSMTQLLLFWAQRKQSRLNTRGSCVGLTEPGSGYVVYRQCCSRGMESTSSVSSEYLDNLWIRQTWTSLPPYTNATRQFREMKNSLLPILFPEMIQLLSAAHMVNTSDERPSCLAPLWDCET